MCLIDSDRIQELQTMSCDPGAIPHHIVPYRSCHKTRFHTGAGMMADLLGQLRALYFLLLPCLLCHQGSCVGCKEPITTYHNIMEAARIFHRLI